MTVHLGAMSCRHVKVLLAFMKNSFQSMKGLYFKPANNRHQSSNDSTAERGDVNIFWRNQLHQALLAASSNSGEEKEVELTADCRVDWLCI